MVNARTAGRDTRDLLGNPRSIYVTGLDSVYNPQGNQTLGYSHREMPDVGSCFSCAASH